MGDFRNGGREYRPKGRPEPVRVHDFIIPELGRAAPYGVYDIADNAGWVSVGIDNDTASFAVNSIRRWWKTMGRARYPHAAKLLITADCGGSNGVRVRLWKRELQALADELGLAITVCHLPPGTSKWNKIEHRLFSFITQNWRGKPLVSLQTIVQLIAATTTATGLKVRCAIDRKTYPAGVKVTDREMDAIDILRHSFHGEWNYTIPRLRENPKTPLAKRRDPDSTERMIRPGFLDIESRQNLIELARDGLAAHRLARRANALVLLDDGMSCEAIAKVLLLDDDTIRTWYRLYEGDGIEGLTNFSYEGSACQLSGEQQEKLKAWVATALPRTTRQVGAWIENEFGVVYEGRSGLIALLHRLGLEYHKPNVIPRKLDEEKQRAFIEGYEKLLNSLGDDEAVLFADAVHPTHAARPVGCWAPSQEKLAIEQTSGRQRINIHGAIDLETGQTRMIEALTIDAASTIRLLQSIEALYPMLALIHVFLDNARYHHAKLVQEWLALPGRRIKLHFIPTYCPHLNPIERLWGLMHRNVTHNKCYATCAQFADATLSFLREKVPGNWADLCDSVTDNFRIINPKDFRVMT